MELKEAPSLKEVVAGSLLFTLNLVLYCANTMLIRVVLMKYRLQASELTYLISAPLIPLAYLGMKTTAPENTDLLSIPRDLFWAFLGRCVCGFLSDVLLFTAFQKAGYARAFSIGKLETVLAPIVAWITLGDRLKPSDLVTLGLVALGVVLMFYSEQNLTSTMGLAWALMSSVAGAFLFIFCRKIDNKIHYSVALLYYLVLSSLAAPLISLVFPVTQAHQLRTLTADLYSFVLAIVGLFFVHTLLMSASWKYNTSGMTGILLYLCIPITYLLEWLVKGRTVDWTELIGASIVFVTCLGVALLRLFKLIN